MRFIETNEAKYLDINKSPSKEGLSGNKSALQLNQHGFQQLTGISPQISIFH